MARSYRSRAMLFVSLAIVAMATSNAEKLDNLEIITRGEIAQTSGGIFKPGQFSSNLDLLPQSDPLPLSKPGEANLHQELLPPFQQQGKSEYVPPQNEYTAPQPDQIVPQTDYLPPQPQPLPQPQIEVQNSYVPPQPQPQPQPQIEVQNSYVPPTQRPIFIIEETSKTPDLSYIPPQGGYEAPKPAPAPAPAPVQSIPTSYGPPPTPRPIVQYYEPSYLPYYQPSTGYNKFNKGSYNKGGLFDKFESFKTNLFSGFNKGGHDSYYDNSYDTGYNQNYDSQYQPPVYRPTAPPTHYYSQGPQYYGKGYKGGLFNKGGFNKGGYNKGGLFNKGGYGKGGYGKGGYSKGGFNKGSLFNKGGFGKGGFGKGGFNKGYYQPYRYSDPYHSTYSQYTQNRPIYSYPTYRRSY